MIKKVFDKQNNLIDTELRMSDFTREGVKLIKSKVSSWENSKSARNNPPDFTALNKQLKIIRSRQGS
ncbi:hypothetical protein PPUJ20028_41070 [Pseudomonas putida]|uniref:Uncharacterized protein n=1 Tax=Pseudomonas putida TaxID=303 RepID=A0AA37VWQ3_PSEPU|nr:hypothetical protein PPUJ20028_41070 [Pseudomonas putida]GLO37054.1 hypothetical protein PPUN14671_38900 [Pseudomonas putida]